MRIFYLVSARNKHFLDAGLAGEKTGPEGARLLERCIAQRQLEGFEPDIDRFQVLAARSAPRCAYPAAELTAVIFVGTRSEIVLQRLKRRYVRPDVGIEPCFGFIKKCLLYFSEQGWDFRDELVQIGRASCRERV